MRAAWVLVAGLGVAGAGAAAASGSAARRGGSPAVPYAAEQPRDERAHGPADTGLDVLSDTKGVNFNPYLKSLLASVHGAWLPLLPAEARLPKLEQGDTLLRFTIDPAGRIVAMHLDGSAHDTELDRAAWRAVTSVAQFPPLPKEFTGPHLELRIHFLVNKDAPTQQASAR